MTSITVRCECGERYHANAEDVGRRIRCRRCARVVAIEPAPAAPPSAPAPAEPPRRRRRRRTRHGAADEAERAAAWTPIIPRRAAPSGPWVRGATLAAWSYLAAVCLVAALMWGLGDRWWPATVLLFMGRWVFLLPLALLVPAALLLRRALLVPLLLATVVTLGPVMGLRTGWRRFLPAGEGMPFRVITFNVARASPELAFLLPVLLPDWRPDVLALQECGRELQTELRAVKGWSFHSEAGLCLLSRHPIESAAVMDRRLLAHIDRRSDVGGAGFVVRYALRTPAGTVHFTNLHLETPRQGLEGLVLDASAQGSDVGRLRGNTTVRELESDMARSWVDSGGAPLLVAGDFNTPVESRIFQTHWGDLANAFSRAGRGFGMTKHNGWIRVRIDHVLAGPRWQVRSAVVGRDLGSDHRPLIADLVLLRR